jgi:choline dehydrogenase-like flavoprotein
VQDRRRRPTGHARLEDAVIIEEHGRSATVHTDVCVIGAGPAGLTFTRQCIDAPFRVTLLEGGDLGATTTAPAYDSGTVESPYYGRDAIAMGRREGYGGTANGWGHLTRPGPPDTYARTLPGEAIDFESRSWQDTSGWPIGRRELDPYYAAAHIAWTGTPMDNATESWARPGTPPLPLRDGPLRTKMAQYGSAAFFLDRVRGELAAAGNVTVHLDTTVLTLESPADGTSVRRAQVRRADGSVFTVTAELFVLAGGGIENARLLLESDATRPGAPGNRHDNVGRYVTDHPEFLLGRIVPSEPSLMDQIGLYDIHQVDDVLVNGLLTLTEEYKRAEQLLNVGAVVIPRPAHFATAAQRAVRSLRPLLRGDAVERPLSHVRSLLSAPGDVVELARARARRRRAEADPDSEGFTWYAGGWSHPTVDRSRFGVLEVHVAAEQTPARTNQLRLTSGRDRVGRARVELDLQWSVADQQNLLRSMRVMAAEIEGSGIGEFEQWVSFSGPTRPVNVAVHHPMGSTRMHESPELGVVDENCRVHGLDNVYVAGSSVFTTGLGYSNPTLTIAALSTRLAEHVSGRLTGRTPAHRPDSPTAEVH